MKIGHMKFGHMKFGLTKILLLASAIALMTASAQAQSMGGRKHQQKTDKTTAAKPKADDKAYAAALKTLPDKQFDPWRNVR